MLRLIFLAAVLCAPMDGCDPNGTCTSCSLKFCIDNIPSGVNVARCDYVIYHGSKSEINNFFWGTSKIRPASVSGTIFTTGHRISLNNITTVPIPCNDAIMIDFTIQVSDWFWCPGHLKKLGPLVPVILPHFFQADRNCDSWYCFDYFWLFGKGCT